MAETNPHHRHDRHLALAEKLTAETRESVTNKFIEQRVLLTGDTRRLATVSGQLMIRVAANLIARFCPKIDVVLPPDLAALQAEIVEMLRKIDNSSNAEFRAATTAIENTYVASLSIGTPSEDFPNCTVIDAEGWLAKIGEHHPSIEGSIHDVHNPFGALMASALGAAEVFKHLLKPLPGKAFHFGNATFSTFNYSVNGNDRGPQLPKEIVFPDSLLVGVGAVGNAFLLSLSNLAGVRGNLMAVDNETVDDSSNLNRYLLAFADDADPQHPTLKTDLAVRLFEGSNVKVQPFQETLEEFVKRIYRKEIATPKIVLSAVDNNEARLVLQQLWPDLLLEGATDDTLSQISRHEYDKGLACLLCIHDFGGTKLAFSYTAHMAALSGLSEDLVKTAMADAALVLTPEHVKQAAEERREFLSANLGAKICSVFSELEKISSRPPDTLPTRATVSFVSMISGLLMAAEFIKYAAGLNSALETFFNIDSMFPLVNAALQRVNKVQSCYCSTHAAQISRYRHER